MKAEYDFSKGRRGPAVPTKGKTRITIYLDDQIVSAFTAESARTSIGYQTLINEALGATPGYGRKANHSRTGKEDCSRRACASALRVQTCNGNSGHRPAGSLSWQAIQPRLLVARRVLSSRPRHLLEVDRFRPASGHRRSTENLGILADFGLGKNLL